MITKNDLGEIIGREITGIMINPASVSLSFNKSNEVGGWILMQCRYLLRSDNIDFDGDATVPQSAQALLHCLRRKITNASFDEAKVLTFFFSDGQFLKLIPQKDGLESYVLHTRQGIVPIIDF
jgi:hypothetical protein